MQARHKLPFHRSDPIFGVTYYQSTLIVDKVEQPPRGAIFNHSAIVMEAKCHWKRKHALSQTGSTWCILVSHKILVEKKT